MSWPVKAEWDQHLDELNQKKNSCPKYPVQLIRIEAPAPAATVHVGHVHPYWQMEVVKEAGFSISINGGSEIFPESGDILVIPPHSWHHFLNIRGNGAYCLKFNIEELNDLYPFAVLKASEELAILYRAILEQAEFSHRSPDETGINILEHMISAVFDIYANSSIRQVSNKDYKLVKEIKTFIEESLSKSTGLKVAEIAEWKGYSSVYLNRIFKRFMGISLKVFIDQSCFEISKRLLCESNLSVSETAYEMGFPDLYSFSRFFKRMSGLSPLQFRNKFSGLNELK